MWDLDTVDPNLSLARHLSTCRGGGAERMRRLVRALTHTNSCAHLKKVLLVRAQTQARPHSVLASPRPHPHSKKSRARMAAGQPPPTADVTLPRTAEGSVVDAAAPEGAVLPHLSGWPSVSSVLLVADVVSTLCGKSLGVKAPGGAELAGWLAQAAGACVCVCRLCAVCLCRVCLHQCF